jgi:hypothetical protein
MSCCFGWQINDDAVDRDFADLAKETSNAGFSFLALPTFRSSAIDRGAIDEPFRAEDLMVCNPGSILCGHG